MIQYGEAGSLIDIGSWINTEKLQADMVPAFYELGLFNDSVHGIYYKADVKSIVWYPVAGLRRAGLHGSDHLGRADRA